MTGTVEMRGSVASVLFGPTDDGYIMLSVNDDAGHRIVVAGRQIPHGISIGDELEITGRWTQTPKGEHIAVQTARKTLPKTNRGVERWLAKAKVPGIGPAKAKKLVERFGIDAIEKICAEDDEATQIVGKKTMPKAAEAIRGQRREAEIGATLSGHDIGVKMQKKIIDRYGDQTQKVLTTDPYRMILDLDGVAFATADRIARAAGLPEDAPTRIKAAIVDTLRDATRHGHCALYHQQLVERCRQTLYVDEHKVEEQLAALTPRHIVKVNIKGMAAWSTVKVNKCENELARHVARKLRDATVSDFGIDAVADAVRQAQIDLDIKLSEMQEKGAIMALTERISVLTGGPGTGKTLTLRIICEAWRNLSKRIRVRTEEQRTIDLGAPTGKAAKRITETTGYEAKTIHRLLEYRPDINGFERNSANPLLSGMIALDETSMLDVFLSCDLARAWGAARILLIGDVDQLPSVGPGRVLGDLLASGMVPHTRLTQIFRQAAGSAVALGAEEIKNGSMPVVAAPGQGELVHIEIDDTSQAARRIVQMYCEKMPAYALKLGLDPESIQVLCPGHQNEVGTIALNKAIQHYLRGDMKNTTTVNLSDKMVAAVGDKVIQLSNDYENGVFNGDAGRVIEIENDLVGSAKQTHVDFGGKVVTFEGTTLSNLGLAYALSIHKSQGSEFQIVIIPVTMSHYTLLRRTLLYTGTTRAKRICVYIGTKKALRTAIAREDSTTRITTLAAAIKNEVNEDAEIEEDVEIEDGI